MRLNDKCAYTKNSTCTTKGHVNEQAYGLHSVCNLRLYFALARTSIIESSFGCQTKAVDMDQTTCALRHLRRLACQHYWQACQTAHYCSAVATHIFAIPYVAKQTPTSEAIVFICTCSRQGQTTCRYALLLCMLSDPLRTPAMQQYDQINLAVAMDCTQLQY